MTDIEVIEESREKHGPGFRVADEDAVDWLRTLDSFSVDLCITDPPYESLEKHRAVGTTTRLKHSKASSNDWFEIFPNKRFESLFWEIYRVLKKNSHFYLFCDQETMFVAKPIAERVGFKFWKPIIWDKKMIGMGYHYRARYECILFFEKGKRKLNDLGVPDVLAFPRIHRGYPTEKPVALAEVLVKQSSLPGQIVIDPFCGSGAFGVAALMHRRRFTGTDICEEAVRVTKQRLAGVNVQGIVDLSPTCDCGGFIEATGAYVHAERCAAPNVVIVPVVGPVVTDTVLDMSVGATDEQ